MRVDSNTNGHRQWFYFSMKNENKCKIKINIYRFKKIYSLFQRGMKPYVRSRKSAQNWTPAADNVTYRFQRQRNQYGVKKQIKTSVLSFFYTFEHQNDQVFIAAGIPYTYTFLQKQLTEYKNIVDKSQNLTFDIGSLCKSMCGLQLQLISVEHRMAKLIHCQKRKRFVIINARTHSGQSSCSWVLDGILMEFSSSPELQEWILAENICFKIVPMLNPDGVLIGNYRTGIIGDDFNRRFNSGRKEFYPQIWALKKLIATCKKEGEIDLFLDLHGHSVLKNSFIYGPSQTTSTDRRLKNLPYHLFHNSKYFRLSSCKFQTQNTDNIETARIFFQLKEDILTFTCENSLGLYTHQRQSKQMLAEDWQNFGRSILHSMQNAYSNKQITLSDPRPSIPKPSVQKATTTTKPSIICEIQKKIGEDSYSKSQSTKQPKHDKIYLKLPTSINIKQKPLHEPLDKLKSNSISLSQKINRQDQIFEPKSTNLYNYQQTKHNFHTFNNRKHSQIMKIPNNNLIQRPLQKSRQQQSSKHKHVQEVPSLNLQRASTYDNSKTLARQIQRMRLVQQQSSEKHQQDYHDDDMQVIPQNFSQDYSSINDEDSSDQDLNEHQKNYILEYIRSNQLRQSNQVEDEQQLAQSLKQKQPAKKKKQFKFRQIRFKSIEQIYESETNTNKPNSSIKKIKLQIHKFKDTSKQFLSHYTTTTNNNDLDQSHLLPISQQKKLNERTNQPRRTQKDPFVLIQRKDRTAEKSIGKETT